MMNWMQPLRRLPIRLRLTVAFAGAMALVLAGTGAFVYLRMENALDASVDQGLRSRASDLGALVRQSDEGLTEAGGSPLTERGENVAQILDPNGKVVDGTPRLRSRPLLGAAERRRSLRGTLFLERSHVAGFDAPVRLLGAPVSAQGKRLLVVVGAPLDDKREALQSLLLLLALGGPVALLLASLTAYGVTAAALRPVESMRQEAAEVSVSEPGRRLPVSPARDEIGRLGETLNDMLARLEAAFARERTFVSDASHELRTPLAILRTELELALRQGRTVEELHSALESAAEETDRLTQLAEDLLVIARSDQGRLPVRAEELPAHELLDRARDRYAQRAAHAGRELRVENDGGLRLVGDRLRVDQALMNLVENAMRHGEGEVVLAAEASDGAVELHVRDEGPGFPEDLLPSAFERFTRGDPARTRGGAGLGLPIVAAIAAAHGGSAQALNRTEGGADVWIALPRRS
jgi:two-component system OmpR family sensor kinase